MKLGIGQDRQRRLRQRHGCRHSRQCAQNCVGIAVGDFRPTASWKVEFVTRVVAKNNIERETPRALRALATAITLGVLANTIVIPAFAKGHDMTGSARATAIQDWNIEANKFNPITQLPNQFAVYGTCMAKHGQSVG
jgi:hypothetical protein